MTNDFKNQIISAAKLKIAAGWSQNKIANAADISASTISDMMNNKWDLIRDGQWRKLADFLGFDNESMLLPALTSNFNSLHKIMRLAQKQGVSVAVSFDAGVGKSFSAREFVANNKNVFYLNCAEHFSKRLFLLKFGASMGINLENFKTLDIIERIVKHILTVEKPLVIFDEADKLNDKVLMLFIEFYNRLNGRCGFVLMGAPFLQKRIVRGADRNNMGMREIYSRIGHKFLPLEMPKEKDVTAICEANSITDAQLQREIWNDCKDNGCDLRRVERFILKIQIQKAA